MKLFSGKYIERMDIRSLGFTYSETKQTGRKPFDPTDMFKLYTYSYFNGIRSSRKTERECYRNIELMWLIGKEIVAVDGSKFRAGNSRLKYHSIKKIYEKMKYHTEKAEQYMELLDASAKDEVSEPQLIK